MKLYRTAAIGLLCAFTLSAHAQWQWVDNNGKKVFSDRPPPADIPERNVTRRPGGAPAPSAAPQAAASAGAASAPALPRPSGKDTALEKNKAQAEAAEAARKKAEDDRLAATRMENCQRARQALQGLQSGNRVAVVNAQGEREFLSDDAVAAETQRVQGIVQSDCR